MTGGRLAKAFAVALITVLLLIAGALAYVWSGAYDVAATRGHTPAVQWVLETLQRRSITARADEVPPRPPVDEAALEHGFEHYRAMCVVCHGAPGIERGEFGQGMTPTPPDLAEVAAERSPAEIFRALEHGVKLAGMPAFGPTHSDEELWGLVAFVERLPELGAEGYARLEARRAAARDSLAAAGDSLPSEDGGHSHAPGAAPHAH